MVQALSKIAATPDSAACRLLSFWDTIMATRFSVFLEVPTNEGGHTQAVAEEMFFEIRRLESLLSRFVEDSEISQINRLRRGEEVIVSPETHRCLELALEAKQISRGRYDAAYLSQGVSSGTEAFALLSRPFRVMSLAESLQLDLGGIGKGFALERVSEIPVRYGYTKVLLCADGSTILALDPPHGTKGWPVQWELDGKTGTLELANESISCSGKTVRGEHIFDTQKRQYATTRERVYVQMASPALSDALSTAAMTMPEREKMELELRGCVKTGKIIISHLSPIGQ